MALLVQKFGGTSLADFERLTAVANIISDTVHQGNQVVVVVSAMGHATDELVKMTEVFDGNLPSAELDVLLSTGEQVSTAMLSMTLHQHGIKAQSFNGSQAGMQTDDCHSRARLLDIDTSAVEAALAQGIVPVVTGFQGVTDGARITTLGRGGSDTTAVAIAACLNAEECQIFTDVKGVYTTDPRLHDKAQMISYITFEEMLEMASLGSKVLQTRAVNLAAKYSVSLRVLSSFEPCKGTLIIHDEDNEGTMIMEKPLVSAVVPSEDEAKLTMSGIPDEPGIASKVIGPVSEAGINIDVIVQNVSDDAHHINDLTFTVSRNDMAEAYKIWSALKNN